MSDNSENPAGNDFTAEMRDQQAREKDPYGDPDEDKGPGSESFISQEQHRCALQMLGNPDMIQYEALCTGDTVPAVRWKCQQNICGIPQEPVQSTSANSSKKNSKREHKER
ncbi:hypothetical protein PG993_010700 [Apiospora rasikravindrae]|uniref:Uncharacterized protein n=1 Tax=Apiospora rasikravindrae TaxID=990691 RepID=A0ABR1SC56_9PEZI